MSDRVFIDTNLLVYSISTDPVKATQIEHLLHKPFRFIISTQIINEFANTCFRKNLLPATEIKQVIEGFLLFFELVTPGEITIRSALDLKQRYGYSWYDSMVIASALEQGCSILFSEDLQNGQTIEGQMTILNPFTT